MSEFLHHEPCPECGSRDNVGVWDDGHKYCFGCGWIEPGTKLRSLIAERNRNNYPYKNRMLIPFDCTTVFPQEPESWLNKLSVGYTLRLRHNIKWSPSRQMVIFPIYDVNGNLLMWQGRCFSQGAKDVGLKYHTEGEKESIFHVINPESNGQSVYKNAYVPPGQPLILVEGILDAIKVGIVAPAMPLFGSTISPQRAERLSHITDRLILWLDHDKLSYAVRWQIANQFRFRKVEVIGDPKLDPKEYTVKEIVEILGDRL